MNEESTHQAVMTMAKAEDKPPQPSGFGILSAQIDDIRRQAIDQGQRLRFVETEHGTRLGVLEDKSTQFTIALEAVRRELADVKATVAAVPGQVTARVKKLLAGHVRDEERMVRAGMAAIITILLTAVGGLALQIIQMMGK